MPRRLLTDLPLGHVARRILLNYAVYSPAIGYSQGMSDLVAPLLAEVLDESDTFWCFVGLMQNTIFVSSPRDEDMERQLVRLRRVCGWAVAAGGCRKAGWPCRWGRGDLARGLWGRHRRLPGPGCRLPAPHRQVRGGLGRASPARLPGEGGRAHRAGP